MRTLHRLLAPVAAGLVLAAAGAALAQPAFRDASSASALGGIAYVGRGNASTSNNCATAVAPTTPAGTNGELLVALYTSSDSSTATLSAGWNTLLASNPVADHSARIFWRFADGSGNDSLTVTRGGTCNRAVGQIARFSGVHATTPFDTGAPIPAGNCTAGAPRVMCSYQNSATVTSGQETTVSAAAMSIFAVFIRGNDGTGVPAGFTESFDSGAGGGLGARVSLKYRAETTAGLKAAVSIGKGGGADPNHGVLFALRPAAAGLTIATPALTQVGDLMVAAVAVEPSTIAITAPGGWTAQAPTVQAAGNSSRQQIFVKFATLADLVSHTWTFSGTQTSAAGGIASYAGADTTTPIDAFGGNVTPSDTQHTANSINTTVPNTRVIATYSFTSSRTWAQPAGTAERVDVSSLPPNNNSGISLGMADFVQPLAGATGNRTADAGGGGGANDTGTAHQIALRSALYFDILSGDAAVRCPNTPIPITIVARSSTGLVLSGYTGLVTLSTSTSSGTWTVSSANGTLNDPVANDGAATYQFVAADRGMVTLNLANTSQTTLTVSVRDNATGITSTGAAIDFVDRGYAFTVDPVQVAGRPQAMTMTYYDAPACTPSTGQGNNGNQQLKLWLSTDPAHPGGATPPGATAVTSLASIPAAEPGGNNITFNFAGGSANFTLTTSDVGKYILNVRDGNTARRGTSPPIVTRPFGLAIRGANAATAIQHGADHTSAILAAAGDNFALTVAAYLWAAADDANNDGVPDAGADITNNGLVPRYAWDTTLSAGAFLPAAGVAGAITFGGGTPTLAQASFAGGAASAANARYSEAGNIEILATAFNYLNSPGINATGGSRMDGLGTYVGRFRPKHFALDGGTPATLANRALLLPCASAFSYMDESMRFTLRLLAQNTQGGTTQNYTGLYARHDLTANPKVAFGLGARSGTTDLTARVSAVYAGATPAWANGVLDVPAADAIRAAVGRAVPDAPDGPYASISFGIAPADPDGVAMNVLDLDVDNNAVNERKNLGVSGEVRFGRLRLQNAVGSERLALPVPIHTQYWNGTGFTVNTLDSCTTLGRDAIALDFNPPSNLTACETAVSAATVSFASGVGTLTLSAPGAGNNGSVLLTPQLRTPAAGSYCPASPGGTLAAVAAPLSYLLGRWDDAANPDANANTSYDDNPAARAAFGLYGTQPKNFIYFRENY